jgi:NhaP-type Na+/H+ or K+/H+ antiporter
MVGRGEMQQSDMITQAVVVTVTVSLLMHSLTTPLGIRLWPEPSAENSQEARSPGAGA